MGCSLSLDSIQSPAPIKKLWMSDNDILHLSAGLQVSCWQHVKDR